MTFSPGERRLAVFLTFISLITQLLTAEGLPDRRALVLDCNLCKCVNQTADCQGMDLQRFGYVGPEGLLKITLRKNQLVTITNRTFQHNLRLKDIDLSYNHITSLPIGVFCKLSNLRRLDLSFNRLVYSKLPSVLFKGLTQLTVLRLNSQNGRQHPLLPGVVRPLIELRELHMTGTTSVDSSFMNLTSLVLLNFGDEWCHMPNVSDEYYWPLRHLQNLSVISFRNCNIRSLSNSFMSTFIQLKRLDFSCNQQLSPSLEDAVPNLPANLEVFLIDNISGIQQKDGSLTKINFNKVVPYNEHLLALSMNFNTYNERKKISLSKYTPRLKYLSLSNKQTEWLNMLGLHESPSPLTALAALIDVLLLVELRFMDITGIQATAGGYGDPECLTSHPLIVDEYYPWEKYPVAPDCDRNCMRKFIHRSLMSDTSAAGMRDALRRYMKLTSWRVFRSRYNTFGRQTVSCRSNNTYSIPVEEVDISYNVYINRSVFISCSVHAPGLTKLAMRGCLIDSINLEALYGFYNLQYLDISQNRLADVVSNDKKGELFKNSTKLTHLDLSKNYISSVPEGFFQHLASLKTLNLNANPLTYIDFSLLNNKLMDRVDLSECNLKYISHRFIEGLPNSHVHINLDKNQLQCECTDDATFLVQWMEHEHSHLQRITPEHVCANINLTMREWRLSNECVDGINGCGLSVLTILSTVALSLIFCLVITAILVRNRSAIFYRFRRLTTRFVAVVEKADEDILTQNEQSKFMVPDQMG